MDRSNANSSDTAYPPCMSIICAMLIHDEVQYLCLWFQGTRAGHVGDNGWDDGCELDTGEMRCEA